jgi:hypothetical protein
LWTTRLRELTQTYGVSVVDEIGLQKLGYPGGWAASLEEVEALRRGVERIR